MHILREDGIITVYYLYLVVMQSVYELWSMHELCLETRDFQLNINYATNCQLIHDPLFSAHCIIPEDIERSAFFLSGFK